MNERQNFKDKDQSIFEFYEALQMEYLICELRRKIYPRDKDKKYYGKISSFKESKIRDISERNHLPSIFSSEDTRKDISSKIFGEFGLPKFSYRNENERLELQPKDVYYYYNKGVEVRVKLEDAVKVGVITNGIDAEWKEVDGFKFKQLIVDNDEIIRVKFRGDEEETIVLTSRASRVM